MQIVSQKMYYYIIVEIVFQGGRYVSYVYYNIIIVLYKLVSRA